MAQQAQGMDPVVLNDIISRLLEFRHVRPGKQVQLNESEIRQLCTVSREIFLQQPNLLELEAPIKICGASFIYLFIFIALLSDWNFKVFERFRLSRLGIYTIHRSLFIYVCMCGVDLWLDRMKRGKLLKLRRKLGFLNDNAGCESLPLGYCEGYGAFGDTGFRLISCDYA